MSDWEGRRISEKENVSVKKKEKRWGEVVEERQIVLFPSRSLLFSKLSCADLSSRPTTPATARSNPKT